MSHAAGVIRGYADADLDGVLDTWERASRVAHAFLADEFFAVEREQIATQWLPIAETYVFDHPDAGVLGFIALVGDEVGAIFVRPDRQGAGIGRALMDHARSLRPSLELDVFEDNAVGRRFYAAYGFEFVRAHTHEATGRTQHRLRLE